MKACQELKNRMLPIKEKLPDASWSELVEQCFNSNIDLTARH
jgi:xanthine dehydrogenase/oxidase